MALSFSSKLLLRPMAMALSPLSTLSSSSSSSSSSSLLEASSCRRITDKNYTSLPLFSRIFLSRPFFSSRTCHADESHGPAATDHGSVVVEQEFHQLADGTIHNLLEKLEEYGDSLQIDGFDIDYGNQVLTLKLGNLGTYVINKQTPNRQIWLSSPVSGPARFDWDVNANSWIYKRTQANLVQLLEKELEELLGEPVDLT